jgi:4'-phosphopantetheinyl transferase EntD
MSELGAGLLAELVPARAVPAETRADESPDELFPAERALLGRAVPKRQREFTAGRVCARRALSRLGVPPAPLLTGPDREPVWPPGVVGSITHCEGFRAAVVAWDTDLHAIGIDAEPNGPTPEGVLDRIALPAEQDWIRAAASAAPQVSWDRLLFCAKESVYKAWFPLARAWLGFEDALVTLGDDPAGAAHPAGERVEGAVTRQNGTFVAKLLVPGPVLPDGRPLTVLRGRYKVADGLILAAVAVSPAGGPAGEAAGSGS